MVRLLVLGFALLIGALPAAAQTLVTVTGAVEAPNRGAFDPAVDKFLGHHDVRFDRAFAFDAAALAALPQVTVQADFPKGDAVHAFAGPLLADVLAAAGAGGQTVSLQALDGYAVEAPVAEMVAQGAVLATSRDGQALGIGDFGPVWVVFPRAERADLKDMDDGRWVWSVFHIRVE